VLIRVFGSFKDGTVLDVTRSTNVVYKSSDPTVATVSASGGVTALAAGDAVITVTYSPQERNIILTIPVNVPAPIFSVAPAQLNVGQQNIGTSTPRQVTLTNTTEGDLEIASITATGDYSVTDTCVSSSPIAVNGTCTITVNFLPAGTGARAGAIRIENGVTLLPVAFGVTGTALAMKCDANGDGVITVADLLIIRNANGQAASGPHDPRDGNSDGTVNNLDARYCQLRRTP